MADDPGYTVTERRALHGGERRDPRAATLAYNWVGSGRSTPPQTDAAATFRFGYYANGFVNRCINIIADRIAQLPFRAGTNLDTPDRYNTAAPLAQLLGPPPGGPNPETSAQAFWKYSIVNYLTTGRFAWEIDNSTGSIAGLWPLISANVSPIVAGRGNSYFSGFEYTAPNVVGPIEFKREDLVYAWNQSPDNPMEPLSVFKALAWNLGVLVQIDQYNYSFIKNDMKPSTLIVHGGFPDAETKEAWRAQFRANFGGPMNANRTAFSEVDPDDQGNVAGMIDIKQIGATAKDSQLVAIYEQQLDAITSALGVPMSLMDASNRTFSNADREMQNFYELTILPLATEIQAHINRDLAPKLGAEFGWFDFSGVLALKPTLSAGVNFSDVADDMLLNERRGFAGLGPIKPAALLKENEVLHPTPPELEPFTGASAPANAASEPPTPIAPVKEPPPVLTPAKTRAEEIDERVAVARPGAVQQVAWMLEHQLEAMNVRSERATLARAEGKRGRQLIDKGESPASLYDQRFWHEEMRQALLPIFATAASAAAATMAGLVSDDAASGLVAWADKRASDEAYGIVQARYRSLGESTDELTPESLTDAVTRAHEGNGLAMTAKMTAETAYDDAVRQLSGVPRETVRDLLSRITAGHVDLDQAIGELTA